MNSMIELKVLAYEYGDLGAEGYSDMGISAPIAKKGLLVNPLEIFSVTESVEFENCCLVLYADQSVVVDCSYNKMKSLLSESGIKIITIDGN